MKRLILLLSAMLLILAFTASAEDFSNYEAQTPGCFLTFAPNAIMENGDMLFHAWSDREGTIDEEHPWHLLWMRDGKIYRDLAYTQEGEQRWSQSVFLPVGAECYVLLPPLSDWAIQELNDPNYEQALGIYHWKESGMELVTSIPGAWEKTDIKTFGSEFSLWDKATGTLLNYRYDGTLLTSYELYQGESSGLGDVVVQQDGTQFAMIRTAGYPHPACTLYALKNEQILWQKNYQWYVSLSCPGDGFLYVIWRENDDSYSPIRIDCMSVDGQVLLSRTLSADKLVLSCSLITDQSTGNLTIYGTGIARSRKEFNAYVMELDTDLREVSLNVRQFNYYEDTSFSMMRLPSGSFMVFSNGTYEDDIDREPDEPMPESGEPVMVPFDVLQGTDRQGIRIR